MRKYLAAGLVLIVGFTIYISTRAESDFPAGHPGPTVTITVNSGETGTTIANNLAQAGVIKSAKRFISLAIADKRAQGISAGVHTIESHIPSKVAIDQLLDQKRLVDLVIVKEGSTYSDVLGVLRSTHSLNCTSKFSGLTPILKAPGNSLEGQLFPAQYSFAPKSTCSDALGSMLSKFAESAKSSGLLKSANPYANLIIASLVQIEGDPKNFDKVARTILNRLKIGMPLQLNSTVQYAAHLRGRIALSTAAIQINSPYNTYKYVGLPPTPISNPSADAIKAALNPAIGNWLYFITVKPGDTRFTNSYSEFSSWEVLYHRNLSAGAFK